MAPSKGHIPWNYGTSNGWYDKRGYHWIYVIENGRRRAKREHRHIMELHIGRKLLPTEIVHHKDGNARNNDLSNLEIMDHSKHISLHSGGTKRPDTAKRTQQIFANYREDAKHLRKVNQTMLEALEAMIREAGHLDIRTCSEEEFAAHKLARAAIAAAKGETP